MAVRSVLFTCNYNTVRSPMAAAIARARLGPDVRIDSCGVFGEGEEVDGFALAALDEIGLDAADHSAKSFDVVKHQPFDLVVSLTPEAHARTLALKSDPTTLTECWAIEDPTREQGARELRLEAFRRVRDDLRRRVDARFCP